MTEKNNIANPEEHLHDCEGEDCDCMDDENSRIITLDMEDGSQKDFVALDILNHKGQNYIALSEVGSMEYDVLRFVEVDDSLELSIIDDDDEYEQIAEIFNKHFTKLAEEEGDEDVDEDIYEGDEDVDEDIYEDDEKED
nr:hypothetical protein [Candidatus Cloacimonadota bacterium]